MYRGQRLFNQPLAAYNSWRVGGPAAELYRANDLNDLCAYLASLPLSQSVYFLGLGSNTLVRDGGVDGSVVLTLKALTRLEQIDQCSVYAGAGIACAQLARFAARLNLSGLEFFAGIPGTVGGALAMNAGCFGSETWEWVDYVDVIKRNGDHQRQFSSDFDIAYRQVKPAASLLAQWFAGAKFQLRCGDNERSLQMMRQLLDRRHVTQPTNLPSCGSVFRNPPGDYAGRLIEKSGLAGYSIGGASVSTKHANFIVNNGEASAAAIEALITHVITTVEQRQGVSLSPEVRIIGRKSL